MRDSEAVRVLLLRIGGIAVLLAAALGIFALAGGNARELWPSDPPRANYGALRDSLDEASRIADRAARQTGRNGTLAAAKALERAILYSRASARRTGAQRVPPHIQEMFGDYFPPSVMENTRWALSNRNLDLGTAIEAWYGREGGAVTLKDTVVFSTRNAAATPLLWAHELTHAMQYEELGMEKFTRVYVTNPQLLERQARANARRIIIDSRRRARGER